MLIFQAVNSFGFQTFTQILNAGSYPENMIQTYAVKDAFI
jgi:hypothetical protein